MSNQDFRRELNSAFEAISGSPSPALKDRVRSAVTEAPEQRGPYWVAGVAAAVMAAVIIGILFVANPGNRHPNVVPGGTTSTPSASPVASPSTSPAASPSPTSVVSPTSSYACATTGLEGEPGALPVAFIDAMRTGSHPGYDRLTIQFNNGRPLSVDLRPQSNTTFTKSPSGQQVTVAGQKGMLVVIHGVDAHTAYSGSLDIVPGYQGLVEARVVEDFEGTVQLALGLSGAGCYHASFLSNPDRVVIDIQAP